MKNFNYKIDTSFPKVNLLIGTRHLGLLYFDGKTIKRLFRKHRAYGITKGKDRWCACVRDMDSRLGTIISFDIINDNFANTKDEISDVPKDIHQIDFVGRSLILTDVVGGILIEYKKFNSFPKIKLKIEHKIGEKLEHFNSIYGRGGRLLVLSHNQYSKTGNTSKIVILKDYRIINVIKTNARCAHNIYQDKNCIIILDSLRERVMANNKTIKKNMGFVRGMSISDDFIFIGSSKVAENDRDRNSTGFIISFDRKFKEIGRISIPKTQIYEIRRVDKLDYCLSNNAKFNHGLKLK